MIFFPSIICSALAVVPSSSAFLPPPIPSSRSRPYVGLLATQKSPGDVAGISMLQGEDASAETIESNRKKKTSASLALLTFDLDDTLFPVGPVVHDANIAMVERMNSLGYNGATAQGVIDATKTIRLELSKTSPDKKLTYTELRIQAIRAEMERCLLSEGRTTDQLDESVAIDVFDAWLSERHAAAERHLFSDAVAMFECLKANYPDVCVGAITNGRGDPLEMRSTLSSFFDFTVSGEEEGVFPKRKPHPGIYEAAIERYESMNSIPSIDETTINAMPWEGIERGVGGEIACWIHVGDDLANDVGASATCGARAVWLGPDEEDDDGTVPFWSTATKEEIERRKQMNDLARDSVSAKISTLSELTNAIGQILEAEAS